MEYDALWDCLIYDDNLKEEIFRYMQTALIVSSCQVDGSLIGLNRLILLSGPPGKLLKKAIYLYFPRLLSFPRIGN